MKYSLSRYFPEGTIYFYSYPFGQTTGFFNGAGLTNQQEVSARPLVFAGDKVKVLVFPAFFNSTIESILKNDLGLDLCPNDNIIPLPVGDVSQNYNKILIEVLKKMVPAKSLVMAQPYLDEEIRDKFLYDPTLSAWVNDKNNMAEYIPEDHLPKRYAHFANGREFNESNLEIALPCVIKVTSSSSGSGIYICKTADDLEKARAATLVINSTIFVEQFIDAKINIGIQFGIPYDKDLPIEILGFNEQIILNSHFIGGKITPDKTFPQLDEIYHELTENILPKIRAKGWCGIGCLDTLIDDKGNYYFIDPNFRATGMSAFILLTKNGIITKSLASFSGSFSGTEEEFRENILPFTQGGEDDRKLAIIALSQQASTYNFNAALLFKEETEIPTLAKELLLHGMRSEVLDQLAASATL